MPSLSLDNSIVTYSLLGAALLVLLKALLSKNSKELPLPPGPPRIPFIGSAHLIPKEQPWLAFSAWRKQYGDIVYFSALGQHTIVLNSAKAVIDLLDRRGTIYSDRPFIHMADMAEWKGSIALARYGTLHHGIRKPMSTYMSPRMITEKLHHVIEQKTVQYLLKPLLDSPSRYLQHIRNSIAATVILVAYGREITEQDPLVELVELVLEQFSIGISPGAYLVEFFPILRHLPEWFPGAGFKRQAKEWGRNTIRLINVPYNDVREQLKSETALPSFAADLIQSNANPTAEEEYRNMWGAATFYTAGADTTVSAISSFFLAMTLYPDVQKKAQDEIDNFVGNARLPTFSDRGSMPYLDAMVKELLRWNPVVPLALPHLSMESDTYAGYSIPKGTTMLANTWAILHEESLYPSPFEFSPERFLSLGSKVNEHVVSDNADVDMKAPYDNEELPVNPDPARFAFGYGRRVCPGQYLADATIWITVATVLAVYDILPALDEKGKIRLPQVEYESGIISHPKEFECRIVLRSPGSKSLISDAV